MLGCIKPNAADNKVNSQEKQFKKRGTKDHKPDFLPQVESATKTSLKTQDKAYQLRTDTADDLIKAYLQLYPLQAAVEDQNIQRVEQILQNSPKRLKEFDYHNNTALHCVSKNGNQEILELILSAPHLDVSKALVYQNNEGNTPLHMAIMYGNTEVCIRFLQYPLINVSISNRDGMQPLHMAAFYDQVKVLQYLIDRFNISVNSVGEKRDKDIGKTPLHYAAQRGHIQVCKFLLQNEQINVNSLDCSGSTPLHLAIENKRNEVCRILLSQSTINPNVLNVRTMIAPIHIAAQQDDIELCETLIDCKKVDINKINQKGETSLHLAIHNNKEQVFSKLMENPKINYLAETERGDTPLHYASKSLNTIFITKLVEQPKIQINHQNSRGETALHLAVHLCKPEICHILLEDFQIDVNIADNNGQTPLYIGAFGPNKDYSGQFQVGYDDICRELIQHPKIQLDRKSNQGFTPMEIAHQRGHKQIEKLIEKEILYGDISNGKNVSQRHNNIPRSSQGSPQRSSPSQGSTSQDTVINNFMKDVFSTSGMQSNSKQWKLPTQYTPGTWEFLQITNKLLDSSVASSFRDQSSIGMTPNLQVTKSQLPQVLMHRQQKQIQQLLHNYQSQISQQSSYPQQKQLQEEVQQQILDIAKQGNKNEAQNQEKDFEQKLAKLLLNQSIEIDKKFQEDIQTQRLPSGVEIVPASSFLKLQQMDPTQSRIEELDNESVSEKTRYINESLKSQNSDQRVSIHQMNSKMKDSCAFMPGSLQVSSSANLSQLLSPNRINSSLKDNQQLENRVNLNKEVSYLSKYLNTQSGFQREYLVRQNQRNSTHLSDSDIVQDKYDLINQRQSLAQPKQATKVDSFCQTNESLILSEPNLKTNLSVRDLSQQRKVSWKDEEELMEPISFNKINILRSNDNKSYKYKCHSFSNLQEQDKSQASNTISTSKNSNNKITNGNFNRGQRSNNSSKEVLYSTYNDFVSNKASTCSSSEVRISKNNTKELSSNLKGNDKSLESFNVDNQYYSGPQNIDDTFLQVSNDIDIKNLQDTNLTRDLDKQDDQKLLKEDWLVDDTIKQSFNNQNQQSQNKSFYGGDQQRQQFTKKYDARFQDKKFPQTNFNNQDGFLHNSLKGQKLGQAQVQIDDQIGLQEQIDNNLRIVQDGHGSQIKFQNLEPSNQDVTKIEQDNNRKREIFQRSKFISIGDTNQSPKLNISQERNGSTQSSEVFTDNNSFQNRFRNSQQVQDSFQRSQDPETSLGSISQKNDSMFRDILQQKQQVHGMFGSKLSRHSTNQSESSFRISERQKVFKKDSLRVSDLESKNQLEGQPFININTQNDDVFDDRELRKMQTQNGQYNKDDSFRISNKHRFNAKPSSKALDYYVLLAKQDITSPVDSQTQDNSNTIRQSDAQKIENTQKQNNSFNSDRSYYTMQSQEPGRVQTKGNQMQDRKNDESFIQTFNPDVTLNDELERSLSQRNKEKQNREIQSNETKYEDTVTNDAYYNPNKPNEMNNQQTDIGNTRINNIKNGSTKTDDSQSRDANGNEIKINDIKGANINVSDTQYYDINEGESLRYDIQINNVRLEDIKLEPIKVKKQSKGDFLSLGFLNRSRSLDMDGFKPRKPQSRRSFNRCESPFSKNSPEFTEYRKNLIQSQPTTVVDTLQETGDRFGSRQYKEESSLSQIEALLKVRSYKQDDIFNSQFEPIHPKEANKLRQEVRVKLFNQNRSNEQSSIQDYKSENTSQQEINVLPQLQNLNLSTKQNSPKQSFTYIAESITDIDQGNSVSEYEPLYTKEDSVYSKPQVQQGKLDYQLRLVTQDSNKLQKRESLEPASKRPLSQASSLQDGSQIDELKYQKLMSNFKNYQQNSRVDELRNDSIGSVGTDKKVQGTQPYRSYNSFDGDMRFSNQQKNSDKIYSLRNNNTFNCCRGQSPQPFAQSDTALLNKVSIPNFKHQTLNIPSPYSHPFLQSKTSQQQVQQSTHLLANSQDRPLHIPINQLPPQNFAQNQIGQQILQLPTYVGLENQKQGQASLETEPTMLNLISYSNIKLQSDSYSTQHKSEPILQPYTEIGQRKSEPLTISLPKVISEPINPYNEIQNKIDILSPKQISNGTQQSQIQENSQEQLEPTLQNQYSQATQNKQAQESIAQNNNDTNDLQQQSSPVKAQQSQKYCNSQTLPELQSPYKSQTVPKDLARQLKQTQVDPILNNQMEVIQQPQQIVISKPQNITIQSPVHVTIQPSKDEPELQTFNEIKVQEQQNSYTEPTSQRQPEPCSQLTPEVLSQFQQKLELGHPYNQLDLEQKVSSKVPSEEPSLPCATDSQIKIQPDQYNFISNGNIQMQPDENELAKEKLITGNADNDLEQQRMLSQVPEQPTKDTPQSCVQDNQHLHNNAADNVSESPFSVQPGSDKDISSQAFSDQVPNPKDQLYTTRVQSQIKGMLENIDMKNRVSHQPRQVNMQSQKKSPQDLKTESFDISIEVEDNGQESKQFSALYEFTFQADESNTVSQSEISDLQSHRLQKAISDLSSEYHSSSSQSKPMVIKQIRKGLLKSQESLRLIQKKLLNKEIHPNVRRCYNKSNDDDYVYLHMERCNMNIKDAITYFPNVFHKAGNSQEICYQLGYELIKGVKFLHEQGIIHGDIRPENVYLHNDVKFNQQDLGMQLLGIQGVIKISSVDTILEQQIDIFQKQSEEWRAPEIIGDQNYATDIKVDRTKEADIFQLGCIVNYILTSKHPFQANQDKVRACDYQMESLPNTPEARSLVKQMTSRYPSCRPDMFFIINHPSFWSATKKLQFISGIAEYAESLWDWDEQLETLEGISSQIYDYEGWEAQLSQIPQSPEMYLQRSLLRSNTVGKRSLKNLLKYIKGYYYNYNSAKISDKLRQQMGLDNETIYRYFQKSFPELIVELYKWFLYQSPDELKQKLFKLYFPESSVADIGSSR